MTNFSALKYSMEGKVLLTTQEEEEWEDFNKMIHNSLKPSDKVYSIMPFNSQLQELLNPNNKSLKINHFYKTLTNLMSNNFKD